MVIRELRVRYELDTAMGNKEIHGVVCNFNTVKPWIDKVKDAGYRLVGIDERFRNEDKWMPLSEGWKSLSENEAHYG